MSPPDFIPERLQARAHAGGVAQIFVGGPQNRRHALDHHGQARAAFVAFGLGFLEILEHAVDGYAQKRQLVLAGHVETSRKIAARADLRDVFGEVGDARYDEALEQVQGDRAENETAAISSNRNCTRLVCPCS